jgi:hypothetical protein
MKVFMRSDEYWYEEFEAADIIEALATINRLRESALKLKDGIEREIGIFVNRKEE